MAKEYRNSGEFLADHALRGGDEPEYTQGPVVGVEGPVRTTEPKPRKRTAKRKLSVLNAVLGISAVSAVVVLYIYNAIRVGELSREIGELQAEALKLQHTNEVLRAEVNRKSTLERITLLATTGSAMINPRQQPQWFVMDEALERRARELESGENGQ